MRKATRQRGRPRTLHTASELSASMPWIGRHSDPRRKSLWRTACSHCRECFFFFFWDRSLRLWLPRPRNVVDGASAPGQLHGRASRSVVPGAAAARHGVAVELNRTAARYPTRQDRTRWAMDGSWVGSASAAGPRLARRGVHRPVSRHGSYPPARTHMHACADEDGVGRTG